MPLYDYHCEDCGSVSELLMNVSSDQPKCAMIWQVPLFSNYRNGHHEF